MPDTHQSVRLYDTNRGAIKVMAERSASVKRLQREIAQTREFLESLIATAGEAVIFSDRDGIVSVWNAAAQKLYGYSAEEAIGESIFSLHIPEEKREEAELLRVSPHGGQGTQGYEAERKRKDGSPVWVSISNAPMLDKRGRYLGVISIHRDISERKRSEREVLQTKEFYENLVGNAGDAVLSTTSEGVVTSWNRGAESLYGFTEEEALGKDVRDLIVPEDRRGESTHLINTAAAGQYAIRVETVRLRKGGTPLEVEVTLSPIRDSEGNVVGVSGIQKDITDRRRLEREVLEAKEYLENLVGSAGDALVGVRTDGTIITWNTGAEELFGFSKDEALDKNIRIIAPDEFLADMEEVMERVQSGEVVRNHETVRYRKDGTPVEIDLTNSPIRDAEGCVIGLCGIYKDVSERKRAERDVLKTKEYYENVVGNAGDAIVSLDIAQRVVTWNVGAERLFGYSQSEALGKEFKDLTGGPDKGEEVCEAVRRSFAGGKVRTYEAQRYKKSGEKVDIAVTATPLRDGKGNVIEFYGILKDITQRKRLEQEVVETKEFLESLIATAGDAIICADRDGVITVWNRAAERLYGYSVEEALGKSFVSLYVPEEKLEEANEILKVLQQGGRIEEYQTQRRRKDGSLV